MYTVADIISAASISSKAFAKSGVSVQLSAANQLLGTYAELLKFVAANSTYKGWEVHHIFEALDINRLNLGTFSPPYEQQICVLLPAVAHQRINSVLRRANPTSLTATRADLAKAYAEAYALAGNYCGSSEAAVAKELLDIFKAVMKNLGDAAAKSIGDDLKKKLEDLQRLRSRVQAQKALHDALIKGSTLSTLEKVTVGAALLTPIGLVGVLGNAALGTKSGMATAGAAVNVFNPKKRPDLSIWAKAEADVAAATEAIAKGELANAIGALAKGEGHFARANAEFTAWRDGIELAGRRAQLAIGVVAAVVVIVAVGAFALEATAVTAVGATTATAQSATGVRIASDIAQGVRVMVTASTIAEEQIGEAAVEQGVRKLAMSLPLP